MKGQAEIQTYLSIIAGGTFAIILSAILVYSVFYPITTSINTNTTAPGSTINTTAGVPSTAGFVQTFAVAAGHNQGGSLLITFYNSSATGGTANVTIGGTTIGGLKPANNANNTVTFSNITLDVLVSPRTSVQYTNITTPSAMVIVNATLTWNDTQFPSTLPQDQQNNFSTVLLIVGFVMVLVCLVVLLKLIGYI